MAATVEEVPYEEFKTGEVIGSGFFGVVYKAKWRNLEIAVKRILPGREDKKIEREINHLARVNHENIVKLYGRSKHEDSFLLLMEYVDGGSLSSFLHANSKPSYSLSHALNWAHQIAEGVAYLHAMEPKVIHRDIKPLNALLCRKGLSLKICDFGTVVDLSQSISINAGTARYKAPEVFRGLPINEKCDVYSWAITFWEILSRKIPLEQYNAIFELSMAINAGETPKISDIMAGCPEDVVSVITACWDKNPQRRHSMALVAYIIKKFVSEAGPLQPIQY
ncbi:mitogen-activated protein kinase kinase kinase 7 [Drosophila takahashii]|uniref:mitogen-activated protein kinase kinase kinase 7 n=1 Tax=Drosophila takahashii TaxID=29030 RepID=UPI001CF801A5|nr:mitogen-activated protein kinase kinase kinase 7 [Drosophila takahashii]